MARPRKTPGPNVNATDLHRAWLQLVDTDGPFLAIPPLKRVWPNGIPDFRATHSDRFDALVEARKAFESTWEVLDRDPDSDIRLGGYRTERDKWVETVLRDVVGWGESLEWGVIPGVEVQSPNRAVTVTPQGALPSPEGIGALVLVVDPTDSLRQTPSDLWAATPIDRCEALLRENRVEIGIVTDGRWWGLVCAREGSMAASGIVDALTWVEEPRARDAFLTLVGRQHIIGGDPAERLPVLFKESIAAAEEITEALGAQVRRAVELLIQSFSESAAEAKRRGMPDPLPERKHDTYEAAVTVMMRAVFLLFAEERGLLPAGELFEQGYGIAGELDRLTARTNDESEEALDATWLTWHRLLATSQALYSGASFENLRMPAYGGSLFDPTRFPFLTDINEQGALAVTVSDRVMLHVLRSIQVAYVKGERRQISFRDIDVEQIGYIYEGLLGYTCATVDEPYLGLFGTTGAEPEMPLAKLEELATDNPDPKKLAAAILAWVAIDQPSIEKKLPTATAIIKALRKDVDASLISSLTQIVRDDQELLERVRPWLGLIRQDLRRQPLVVLRGGLIVKETPSRKNAGAHYTPKSLAEEVVLHALQPICYSPGPHQTSDSEQWKLKSSDELLGLKVADIACGSGAFLVAAANYLAGRVVEAWIAEDAANKRRKGLDLRAIRQVVANCIYGADINDMAVEMCKLSLWLVSLDRDLPFSFVDDKVFLGNSLLGLTSLDQIRRLHIDPTRTTEIQHYYEYDVDVEGIIRRAVDLRQRLASEIDENDPARTSSAKQRQLAQLQSVTADLRQIGDGIVASALLAAGKTSRALDERFENLRIAVKAAHPGEGHGDRSFLDAINDSGLTPSVPTDYARWRPLHWVVEAPDVMVDHGGFDAVVGNPPFLGGKKLSGSMGSNVREALVTFLADGRKGEADLVGYFFLRAASLLNPLGTFGLIASESMSEGETRRVVLDPLTSDKITITVSVKRRKWPSSAQVHVSIVWATLAAVATDVPRLCDGSQVSRIDSSLEPASRIAGQPKVLSENSGLSFMGSILSGQGFVLEQDEFEQLIAEDPISSKVCRPYVAGATEVNQSPTPGPVKYVIDFADWSLEEASQYVGAMAQVRALVKPKRDKVAKAQYRERWWQFAERGRGLHDALGAVDHILAIVLTSDTLLPVRLQSGAVYSNSIGVIALHDFGSLALLTSSAHQMWAMRWGSTLDASARYTTSDVFETFPRPAMTEELERLGAELDTTRSEVMERRGLGLTGLYMLVNDPDIHADEDIETIRSLQVHIDRATFQAYGWTDVDVQHGFHFFRNLRRWSVEPSARSEILDRLLEENHRRAAAEAAASPKKALKGRRVKSMSEGMETLFS